jgi:hypothetical protein
MKTQNSFLLLFILLLNSCLSDEHLEFTTVPINGSLAQFVNLLLKSGFTEAQKEKENQIILNGVFLGKNCEIYVYGTRKSQTAYKVRVNMPGETPDSLQLSFEKLQKLFSSEYGMGKTRYQQYRNPERFMFNEPGLKRQIRKGDRTKYTIDEGFITLEVQDGYISITYLDKLNDDINEKEKAEETKKESSEAI